MFGDARASSLSDLVQGSLMLKFNKAKRKAEKEMMEQAPTSQTHPYTLFTPSYPHSLLRV
jgi:hypothetical protein